MSASWRWWALLGCFFASGFAALLYQTAWTRLFGAVFGTSELAVATVLAAYMAGLAVGAAAAGRLVGRLRRPVWAYGLLELGIAGAALAVPPLIGAASRVQLALLGGRELPGDAGGLLSALFYLGCAFAVLGLPTTLMGATLPLLARHAVRREAELGRRVGVLYAVNSAGAIGGTLVAGFLLLPSLSLRETVWVGVALNGLVFALAAALSAGEARLAAAKPETRARASFSWILPLILLSGAVSFGYEVLWTRLLGHVLGGSVYAFATMLASVLLGIAVGGALAARFAGDVARAARGFALAQLATAALAFAAFHAIERVPALALWLGAGGRADLGANAMLAMAILVPPSLAIGATFPFAVRVLARAADDAGPASARVFSWNTIGAIVGSVAAGFVVLPALGFAGSLVLGVALNLALAAAAALVLLQPRAWPLAGAAAAGLALLVGLPPAEPWRLLRSSPLAAAPARGVVEFYAAGRAATVLLLREPGGFSLRTNGLPEARIARRGSRPHAEGLVGWLGALPTVLRPEARRMLVVGLGGGMALESLPESLATIDVIELEPEVTAANRAVAALRRADPLADPRVRVRHNDARSALLLAGARYDAIVSQPSHPWSAGASHLYTREFFALVRERLAPDGVFVQWIGLGFVDAELLRGLVATLLAVFPHVETYRPVPGGVLLAAAPAPFDVQASTPRALAAAPDALHEVGIATLEDVLAVRALDAAGARALAAGAPVFRDDRNELATRSPRVLQRPLGPRGASALLAPHDPLLPLPAGVDAGYVLRRLAAAGFAERARALATRLAARDLLETELAVQRGDAGALERVLARDAAGALADARAHEAADDWLALAALDPALARVSAPAALEPEAVRLRARWRIASGRPDAAREALALLDPLLARFPTGPLLTLRAEAAAAAGEIDGALATWLELYGRSGPAQRPAVAQHALSLARTAPADTLPEPERSEWIEAWTPRVRAAAR